MRKWKKDLLFSSGPGLVWESKTSVPEFGSPFLFLLGFIRKKGQCWEWAEREKAL